MITAVVGRTFLNAYNHKYHKQLTPKEFFVEEYFELFFNHQKYMQWVTNSPFVQMKGSQKVHLLTLEERLKKLEVYRKEFLGNVSHELKTPIFNIQGYVLTLLDGGLEDETINRNYLQRAEKSVDRMITINS